MKKICFLVCLIICLSMLTGCFPLSPTTESNAAADTTSEVVLGSDMEIVSKAGHPMLYDEIETVNTVWKNEIDANKVVITDPYDLAYGEGPILQFCTYTFEDTDGSEVEYIGALHIFFSLFDKTVTLDEALKIVATYLPKDTITQYYYEEMSYSELDANNGTEYTKSYVLNDESMSIMSRLHREFSVTVWVDESGNASSASIHWAILPPYFDDETMDAWDYDFFAES